MKKRGIKTFIKLCNRKIIMNICKICGKPIPKTKKVCEDCERENKGADRIEDGEMEEEEVEEGSEDVEEEFEEDE